MPKKYFIQNFKRGSLTEYIKARWGRKGFKRSKKTGRLIIKPDLVKSLASPRSRVSSITRKRARAALTLKKLRRM